jgi:hypothetical protein
MDKLKKINVTYGDFERYKKLNRLTMIYHLDEIDEDAIEKLNIYYKRTDYPKDNNNDLVVTTDPNSGFYRANETTHNANYKDLSHTYNSKEQILQLPNTYKLYEYRTDEILAKLYSVKHWLEKYILGVNCYISDICGEGIVIERFKNQAYVT